MILRKKKEKKKKGKERKVRKKKKKKRRGEVKEDRTEGFSVGTYEWLTALPPRHLIHDELYEPSTA